MVRQPLLCIVINYLVEQKQKGTLNHKMAQQD